MKIRTRMENFAKKNNLVFMFYRDYSSGYEDMGVHYKDYILGVSIKEYAQFRIFDGSSCEHIEYLDLKSALKAFRKIMREN